MRKSSASDGDEYETVRSELSHGDYVTAYDKVDLPNYLVHLTSQYDVIVDIDVEEVLNERGNGGYLLSYGIELVPTYI